MSDISTMDFGEMLDIIVTFNNVYGSASSHSGVRNATQEDYDKF